MVDKEDLLDDEMAVDITSNKRAKGRGMDRTTSDTIDGEYDSLDSTEAEGEAVRCKKKDLILFRLFTNE